MNWCEVIIIRDLRAARWVYIPDAVREEVWVEVHRLWTIYSEGRSTSIAGSSVDGWDC